MKLRNTIIGSLLALVGLSSCEMKDELIGKGNGSSDTGLLNVGVLVDGHVNNVQMTRASEDEAESLSPSADGFKLDVIDGEGFTKTFTYKSEGMEPIELPVGEYTVYAHSSFDFKNILFEPYYGGKQSLSIKKDMTSEVGVTCQMENTKIKLAYTSEFKSTFETWDITITAGSLIHPISEEDGTDPEAVYLKVPENTTQITVNVDAYKADGTKVSDMVNITKPEDTDSNWLGNDALTITMTPGDMRPTDPNQPSEPVDPNPGEPENPDPDPEQPGEGEEDGDDENTSSTVSGIMITVEGVFGEQDDTTIKVPVTPSEDADTDDGNGDSDEDNTGEDKPSGDGEEESDVLKIDIPKAEYILPKEEDKDVSAVITAESGLKNVIVIIEPDNDNFKNALALLSMYNFSKGVNIVDDPNFEAAMNIVAPGIKVPSANATEYSFHLSAFFNALKNMQATKSSGHVFKITVEDNNGNTVSETLNIIVTEE